MEQFCIIFLVFSFIKYKLTMANSTTNNIVSEFMYILIFYIVSSILCIGVLLNLIFLSKWGQSFRIKFIKSSYIINFLSNLLVYLSIIFFPSAAIYIFTQLYYYKSIKLF